MILTHGANSLERGDFVEIGGRKYPFVQIGRQLWITENLKLETAHIKYPNKDINNKEMGLLYQYYYLYREVIPLIPSDWRIPTLDDGKHLFDIGGTHARTYISKDLGGTDDLGFAGNLPGMIGSNDEILGFNDRLYFWYQTAESSDKMYNAKIALSDDLVEYDNTSEGTPNILRPSAMPLRLCKDAT